MLKLIFILLCRFCTFLPFTLQRWHRSTSEVACRCLYTDCLMLLRSDINAFLQQLQLVYLDTRGWGGYGNLFLPLDFFFFFKGNYDFFISHSEFFSQNCMIQTLNWKLWGLELQNINSQFWEMKSELCDIKSHLREKNVRIASLYLPILTHNWVYILLLWLYILLLWLYNSQMWVYIMQFWEKSQNSEFISHNSDFITQNWEFISQFWTANCENFWEFWIARCKLAIMRKKGLWDKKSQLPFFFSVAETGQNGSKLE